MKHCLSIVLFGFCLAGLGRAILAAGGPLPPNTARINVSVFLRITPTVTITAIDPDASETRLDRGMFLVTRSGDKSTTLTVYFDVSGTAGNGVDYATIATWVKIRAGASSAGIEIRPIEDALAEKSETVILTLIQKQYGNYNLGSPSRATIRIYDQSAVELWTLYD